MPTALFLIGYDAYVRPAFNIATALQTHGWHCTFYHLDFDGNTLSERQKRPFTELPTITRETLENLLKNNTFDCVFLGFGGRSVMQLDTTINHICPQSKIVTLFPGICWGDRDNGLLVRAASDVIFCNSQADCDTYQELATIYGFDGKNTVITGYPQIFNVEKKAPITSFDAIKTITYFDQNIIPKKQQQRQYLARKLVQLAKIYPDKTLCIKLRNTPDEFIAHKDRLNLYPLIQQTGAVPSNLVFSTEDIEECIEKTDLALSVSSTALIETMARGILSYALADFGIRHEYGTPYFIGSNILRPFTAIENGVVAYPDAQWLAANAQPLRSDLHIFAQTPVQSRSRTLSPALQDYFAQRALLPKLPLYKKVFRAFCAKINGVLPRK